MPLDAIGCCCSFIHRFTHTSSIPSIQSDSERDTYSHANKEQDRSRLHKVHICVWLLLWPQDLHRIRALYHASTIANIIRHRQVPFNDESCRVLHSLLKVRGSRTPLPLSVARETKALEASIMSDKTMLWRALSRDRGDSLVDRTHQCIPAWTSASCPCDARVVHAKRDNASNGTGSWSLTRASSSFSTATTATRARLLALAHSRGLDRWQECHMVQVATLLLLLLLLLESIRTKILHRDE